MTQFSNSANKSYDLEERTVKFSKNIIDFTKKLPQNSITKVN